MVEYEKHIQELVKFNYEEAGFKVKTYDNGIATLNECKNTVPLLF
jgi:two-component system alkaline phosphatase synthesis response regulator PhoP